MSYIGQQDERTRKEHILEHLEWIRTMMFAAQLSQGLAVKAAVQVLLGLIGYLTAWILFLFEKLLEIVFTFVLYNHILKIGMAFHVSAMY